MELFVGDVEDDFRGADAGGEDEGAASGAGFLVGCGEFHELAGSGLESGEWSKGEDEISHAGELFRRDRLSG